LKYKNPLVPLIIGITLILSLLLLYITPFTHFFEFESLSINQLGISFVAGGASVLWYELAKWLKRSKNKG
jgi:Ca2+-transporting ATPase